MKRISWLRPAVLPTGLCAAALGVTRRVVFVVPAPGALVPATRESGKVAGELGQRLSPGPLQEAD